MKMLGLTLATTILLCGLGLASPQKNQTFRGEIMDSACAETGAHDAMMKSQPNMKTAMDCTLGCVKRGSQYVLYNADNKIVYQLDDQKKPEQFAGQRVMVAGNLDPASGTIHVVDIKSVSSPY